MEAQGSERTARKMKCSHSRCIFHNTLNEHMQSFRAAFIGYLVTLLVPHGAPPGAIFAAPFSSDRCLPEEASTLHESARFSSPYCPHPAIENSRRLTSSHTPKARFCHTPAASGDCAAHWEKETHGRFPDRS